MYKFHLITYYPRYSIYVFFKKKTNKIHKYKISTRPSYAFPKTRTNYGIFNVNFTGANIWNEIDKDLITLSMKTLKAKLKEKFILNY